ncbi:ABC transporter ATP-binding protein [Bathymodiolus septemdierum thioautotrophic gill symbiont]|uniref:Lipopolysaccharide transport system ATP-binding protein n=1 Tax=endosymbiont of Bathymodiolus septemdierum str. Myojin knoll TaxID=1303921 RepID=A0A0P0URL4_9GAMM|nr:ABC transporter ATP-binding protein [Bathymodiolus septemdierum thioautotrophic gill symbiont]BAS67689.1 lipopolysaccharide transport system ATP-binding protein [endosymbiont of Bathymodiolus septemdierum str. Myojin knoll]
MSNIAMKTENLGKKYAIRHESQESYNTFQGVLVRGTQKIITTLNPFQKSPPSNHTTEDFWALKDINFEINQGDRVGIIGPNGAGKSTLLKVLSRITEPTVGKISIKGKIASLLEVGTGFHPELTGRENIFLNGAILGMSRQEIKLKFDEIVDFSGVEKFLDTPVKRYSSGMYVRLAFAVAAHLEPEILIIDEVLAVGDVEFQEKCLGKMKDVSKEGRTILFVSHNMNAIEELCNHAILIDKGKLVEKNKNVRQIINEYLSGGEYDMQSEWINQHDEYKNDYFQTVRFAIEDQQGKVLTQAMRNDEDVNIVIEGQVQRLHTALCVGYALFNENNIPLYRSSFTDKPPGEWLKIHKGKNILTSKIPKRLLNEGRYRMELFISLYCISWINKPQENTPALFFEIQGRLSDSPYLTSKRDGEVLSPILDWKIKGHPKA